MKKYAFPALACVLALILLYQFNELRSEVQILTQQQYRLQSQITNQSSSISHEIQNSLKTEASRLNHFEIRHDEINMDDLTLSTHIVVQPKSIATDTKLSLLLTESSHDFTRVGDSFVLDLSLPMANKTLSTMTICIESGGVRQLEDVSTGFYTDDFFPQLNVQDRGKLSLDASNYHFQSDVMVYLNTNNPSMQLSQMHDFCLFVTEGDKVIFKKPYGPDALKTSPHMEAYTLTLEERIPRSEGPYALWLQATDARGLIHQVLVTAGNFGENGYDDAFPYLYDGQRGIDAIFHPNGTLIHVRDSRYAPPLYQTS